MLLSIRFYTMSTSVHQKSRTNSLSSFVEIGMSRRVERIPIKVDRHGLNR